MFQSGFSVTIRQDNNSTFQSNFSSSSVGVVQTNAGGITNNANFAVIGTISF